MGDSARLPPLSPPVAQARQGPEGTAGCAMARTRLPPLGASASADGSSVSSPRNRHLTRARPLHHARAPLFTSVLSPTWLSSSPAAAAPPVASCRGTTWHLRQRPHPYAVRASVCRREREWHNACTGSMREPGAWETRPTRLSAQERGPGDPTTRVAVVAEEACGRRRTHWGRLPLSPRLPREQSLKTGMGYHDRPRSTRVRRVGRRGRW